MSGMIYDTFRTHSKRGWNSHSADRSWRMCGRHLLLGCQRDSLGNIPDFLFTGRSSESSQTSHSGCASFHFLSNVLHLISRYISRFDFIAIPATNLSSTEQFLLVRETFDSQWILVENFPINSEKFRERQDEFRFSAAFNIWAV